MKAWMFRGYFPKLFVCEKGDKSGCCLVSSCYTFLPSSNHIAELCYCLSLRLKISIVFVGIALSTNELHKRISQENRSQCVEPHPLILGPTLSFQDFVASSLCIDSCLAYEVTGGNTLSVCIRKTSREWEAVLTIVQDTRRKRVHAHRIPKILMFFRDQPFSDHKIMLISSNSFNIMRALCVCVCVCVISSVSA